MVGGLDGGSWGVQQLAGLLASITAHDDEAAVLTGAVHRIAEAIDVEVCALVTADGEVPVAIGFPADKLPTRRLVDVVVHDGGSLEVPGLGELDAAVVTVPTTPTATLVLARSSSPLTTDDRHLARSMGQVLALALRLRGAADRERVLRERSEQQAEALRDANAALLEASRTKDMIISVASHELRTPLTSILGFASTLREHGDQLDAAASATYLDIIERQGQRLLHLIDDLLTVGRLDAGRASPRPRPVAVVPALRVLLSGEDVHVPVRGALDATAMVDPRHLDQIVLNLVTNAHKYGAPPVTVEVCEHDGEVVLAVVDHGPGVPPAFEPELFEHFSQASSGESRESTGTGLGLSIVRGLAEANHGSASHHRHDGTTRFVVTLPRATSGAPEPATVAGAAHGA